MKKLNSRGFTLIELLVVIAIIGILSTIVLASLSTARTKGEDAAIQSTLQSMKVQAELYYSSQTTGNYGIVATQGTAAAPYSADCKSAGSIFMSSGTGGLKALVDGAAARSTAVVCSLGAATVATPGATVWAVQALLKSGSYQCVDSTGNSTTTATTTVSTTDAVCG
ncbi:MAG: hypothetical protein RJB39_582 [Candidatus Parcubacteria bacterium]